MSQNQEYANTAVLDMDLSGRTFKPLPTEYRHKAILESIKNICERYNLQNDHITNSTTHTIIINIADYINNQTTNKTADDYSTQLLLELSSECFSTLDQIIIADDQIPSDFLRNFVLYESSFNQPNLILTWSI